MLQQNIVSYSLLHAENVEALHENSVANQAF